MILLNLYLILIFTITTKENKEADTICFAVRIPSKKTQMMIMEFFSIISDGIDKGLSFKSYLYQKTILKGLPNVFMVRPLMWPRLGKWTTTAFSSWQRPKAGAITNKVTKLGHILPCRSYKVCLITVQVVPNERIIYFLHCKCLQGITGSLQVCCGETL